MAKHLSAKSVHYKAPSKTRSETKYTHVLQGHENAGDLEGVVTLRTPDFFWVKENPGVSKPLLFSS